MFLPSGGVPTLIAGQKNKSVFEVTHSGHQHRDAAFVSLLYGVLVTDTAARLDDCLDSEPGSK